jgi:tRNA A37 threonylcarbamoyladenosine modification protein TsaB
MAWLFIDTARPSHFRFGTLSSAKPRITTVSGRAGRLLPSLNRAYGIAGLRSVEGVCVVHGPGSFSSVRGGVLVANLLARLLRKPLVGVDRMGAEDLGRLTANLMGGDMPAVSYVMPTYDAEPNITVSSCNP